MRQFIKSFIQLLLGLCVLALPACGQQPTPWVETTDQSLASTPLTTPTSTPVTDDPSLPLGGGTGRILFSSYRDGESEIYAMNVDGSDVARLTDDDARLSQPVSSPDGNRIAFVRRRGVEYREIFS